MHTRVPRHLGLVGNQTQTACLTGPARASKMRLANPKQATEFAGFVKSCKLLSYHSGAGIVEFELSVPGVHNGGGCQSCRYIRPTTVQIRPVRKPPLVITPWPGRSFQVLHVLLPLNRPSIPVPSRSESPTQCVSTYKSWGTTRSDHRLGTTAVQYKTFICCHTDRSSFSSTSTHDLGRFSLIFFSLPTTPSCLSIPSTGCELQPSEKHRLWRLLVEAVVVCYLLNFQIRIIPSASLTDCAAQQAELRPFLPSTFTIFLKLPLGHHSYTPLHSFGDYTTRSLFSRISSHSIISSREAH